MARTFMDQLNETPVTYGVLLIYLTMAFLTGTFDSRMGNLEHMDLLLKWGAAAGILVMDEEGWRLVSHAFLHGGVLHLAINSYALLIFAPVLERYLGVSRFILLYLVSAVCGCLVALLVNMEFVALVGGSGALFGMLGAAIAINIRGGRTLLDFLENHGTRQLIAIAVLNLLVGFFIPVVSNSAHIGGFIAGFVLIFCFYDVGRREKVDATGRAIQVGWIALFLSLVGYALHPVMRFDFNLKQYLAEEDLTRKDSIKRFLEGYNLIEDAAFFLQREKEPKTGIPGVAWRELQFGDQPKFRDTFKRWKQSR